jgi:hypothetical protein
MSKNNTVDLYFTVGVFLVSQYEYSLFIHFDDRSGRAAAPLLGLWVRMPPEALISVSCECCVLSEGLATS